MGCYLSTSGYEWLPSLLCPEVDSQTVFVGFLLVSFHECHSLPFHLPPLCIRSCT
jgi:hypothetical protein